MNLQRYGLWLILALGLAVRLAPMVCERQVSQDIVEYENIARHLRSGQGFTSDILAYYAAPHKALTGSGGSFAGPATLHYAFTDRPILLPALLAGLEAVLPPHPAAQILGPLLFLIAVALIFQTVRYCVGPAAAVSAGLLLVLNPALFEVSIRPLTENTVLLSLALIAWAHLRMRSVILAGMACSLAFLARPSTALFAGVLGLIYLVQSVRRREPLRLAQFIFFAAIGPIWVMILNHAMHMPALTLPQSFLFRVRSFGDQLNYFHQGPLYASALECFRANSREVARRVALNAVYYFQSLMAIPRLGMLIALAPIAVAGLSQPHSRPLRRYWLLAVFAALDLGLYVMTWSTYDDVRFLAVTLFVALVLVAIGCHEVLDREPLFRGAGAWKSAAAWAALAVGVVWLSMDIGRGYIAVRYWQQGRRLSDNMVAIWEKPAVQELGGELARLRVQASSAADLPVVASNDPWLVSDMAGLPAAKLPVDLRGPEWPGHLGKVEAEMVVIAAHEWPAEYRSNLEDLETQLEGAGWKKWFDKDQVRAWVFEKAK